MTERGPAAPAQSRAAPRLRAACLTSAQGVQCSHTQPPAVLHPSVGRRCTRCAAFCMRATARLLHGITAAFHRCMPACCYIRRAATAQSFAARLKKPPAVTPAAHAARGAYLDRMQLSRALAPRSGDGETRCGRRQPWRGSMAGLYRSEIAATACTRRSQARQCSQHAARGTCLRARLRYTGSRQWRHRSCSRRCRPRGRRLEPASGANAGSPAGRVLAFGSGCHA